MSVPDDANRDDHAGHTGHAGHGSPHVRPTLQALLRGAIESTGADRGWLLALVDDHFEVLAADAAPGAPGRSVAALVGTHRDRRGVAGLAAATGQPAAVRPRAGDADNEGAGGSSGVPMAVLAAPCLDGDVVGVLELVRDASGFGFDDVETASMLAEIAGAALRDPSITVPAPPSPEQLGAALAALADRDPRRYADVARVVAGLV